MKVSELGEFGLIDLLAGMISASQTGQSAAHGIVSGIGDDAAAWKTDTATALATVDSLVEGVHFTLDTITWKELGWKSLAINLSDIAAMGGVPGYALVALALPGDTDVEAATALYEGMLELANLHDVVVIGGNMCSSPLVSVTISVYGSSPDNRMLRRSTAVPGDTIAVTGYPGSAAAGLKMLKDKLQFGAETATYLRTSWVRPVPRIREGQLLLRRGIVTAIDISDGLHADLGHICRASRVGATVEVEKLPLHTGVRHAFGDTARELALTGGEDYELLFTGSAETIAAVRAEATIPVTVLGTITDEDPGTVRAVDADGNPVPVENRGWEHFH